jgi:rod shape-determining protein MreD
MHQLGFVLFTYGAAVLFVGAGSSSVGGLIVQPHYLLLVVITAVLYFDHWSAIVWAAVAGLLSDCLSTGPLGVEMACFTGMAYMMQHQLRRHSSPGVLRITLLCFTLSLATLALSNTIRLLITSRHFDHARLVLLISCTAAMTALIVGGFRVLQAVFRKIVLRSPRRAASY